MQARVKHEMSPCNLRQHEERVLKASDLEGNTPDDKQWTYMGCVHGMKQGASRSDLYIWGLSERTGDSTYKRARSAKTSVEPPAYASCAILVSAVAS